MFAVDHMGPDAYNATLTRARAAVGEYLDAYERRLLGPGATRLASHPLVPLELLRREAPSRTTALARQLLEAWRGREKALLAQLEILAKGGQILASRAVSVRRQGGAESIPNAVVSVEIINGTTEHCTPREVQLWWASGGSALRPITAVPLEPGARTSVDVSVRGPAATFGDARDVGIDVRADCSPVER